ncbi:MAG: hypothetical protein H7144_08125 [Burkholderiales bacterium]|nr:hypothetical protein [Phycisphaerae bacterium]
MNRTISDLEPLETRRMLAGQHPIAINFNDESLWAGQFANTVAQAKSLGVTAVRLWLPFETYSDRPNALDPVPAFADRNYGDGAQRQNLAPEIIQRAFDLHREGFSVSVVVQPQFGRAPASDSDVRGLIRHFMDATETPGSSVKLKEVIDNWEIGNEVDVGFFWTPSINNKTAGLQRYVDNFLIPAADELHANGDHENVISAGVSYNPADLKIILDRLVYRGRVDAIDYAGFHPYGNYDPAKPSTNEPKYRTLTARAYAEEIGKKLVATEWNVRGYGTDGSRDATWAQAIDDIYRQVILPNYEIAYYFALTNNWAGRGGTITARPASALKHDTSLSVTSSSSYAQLEQYYNSPIVVSEPFYSTVKSWQYGTIAGQVVTSGAGTPPSMRVYVDRNNDGLFNIGEPSAFSWAGGTYLLQYSSREVPAGGYFIRLEPTADWQAVSSAQYGTLGALSNISGANFTVSGGGVVEPPPPPPPPPTTGSISGVVFGDSNNNGLYDSGDSLGPARVVFIDANANGKIDAGEKQTTSNAVGVYTFANLSAGVYKISRVFPAGYRISNSANSYITVTLAEGQSINTAHIGSTNTKLPPPPPPPPGNDPSGNTGYVAGLLFNDTNGNGVQNSNETVAVGRTVYIDVNNNNKLDSGEKSVLTDSAGKYKLANLAAGTYRVRRVMPTGYRLTTPSLGYHLVTLGPGQVMQNLNFGSTSIA